MTANWVAENRWGEGENRKLLHRSTAPLTKLYRRFVGPAVFVAIVKLVVFATAVRTA